MLIFPVLLLAALLAQKPVVAERGYTIWIGPCGYSYYMPETDDGLPPMMGHTKTFEAAEAIAKGQKERDDKLRKLLKGHQ